MIPYTAFNEAMNKIDCIMSPDVRQAMAIKAGTLHGLIISVWEDISIAGQAKIIHRLEELIKEKKGD